MSKVIVSLSFILLFIFFTAMGTIDAAIPQIERDALIALYNSTNGDEWEDNSGWKAGPLSSDGFALPGTENEWKGITCDQENTVTGINLENNNLAGTIPSQLGNLLNLESLYLNSNQLTGVIPVELGNLSKLIILYLDSNQLTGAIPPELGKLSKLYILYLDTNQLTGTIPKELGDIPGLTDLSIYNNQLTGAIPPQLGQLSKLTRLYLDSNRLEGAIPQELGNLSNLEYLYLNSNRLTGIIPWQLGNLSKLTDLSLYSNQLTGSIPPELGNLSKLTDLSLYSNQLTGSIPPELGNLSNLTTLYLDSNRLEGAIPRELGDLLKLKYLYLNSNKLTGKIPDEIENLTNLEYSESDFRWNGLYTNNESLKDVLDYAQIDGDWQSTQTIAPTNVTARVISSNSIEVNWDPIAYTDDEGGYLVYYRLPSDSTYEKFFEINTKYDYRMNITELNPSDKYYFVIKTWTSHHENNQNKIVSEQSAEVLVENIIFISGRIVTQNGRGVKGVTLAFSPSKTSTVSDSSGYYRHAVNPKWSGTVRPTKTGYCFDPDEIELTNVDMDYSLKNITANLSSRNLAGKVTVFGEGVAEVTLTFTNPNGKNETAMTDSNGFYSHKVPYGWFGTVTPSKEQLLFDPPNKRYERPGVIKDRNDENYQLKISLALLVDRRKDNTMIISKEYAKIELNLDPKKNYDDVQKFIIERKESGPGASEPKKIDISKEEGKNSYIYIDEYLEHAKTYTYIAKAINAYDNLIDLSNKVIVK